MWRPESWSRPAGGNPVRVDTGVPGSRPRFVAERRRAERGVESLFGASKHAGLNPPLRDWGSYLRTGNAATKFRQADNYVVHRLRSLTIKKRGRAWTEEWFNGHGLLPAPWHRPLPEGQRNHVKKIIAKPYAGTRTYGLKGGWGTGLHRHRAP